jgi:hypothetical protein
MKTPKYSRMVVRIADELGIRPSDAVKLYQAALRQKDFANDERISAVKLAISNGRAR